MVRCMRLLRGSGRRECRVSTARPGMRPPSVRGFVCVALLLRAGPVTALWLGARGALALRRGLARTLLALLVGLGALLVGARAVVGLVEARAAEQDPRAG